MCTFEPALTDSWILAPVTLACIPRDGLFVILTAVSSTFLAQVLKLFWYQYTGRSITFRILVETGGMPSSHSAAVSSMATCAGIVVGFRSVIFAVALCVALIVMYDASGVRLAAGRMASVLNKLTADVYAHHPNKVPARLKELLGHTPFEVLGGCILGVLLSLGFAKWLLAPAM
ncbi:MAG: divergent PAP2 family protein [Vampirovibrionales bacterium]